MPPRAKKDIITILLRNIQIKVFFISYLTIPKGTINKESGRGVSPKRTITAGIAFGFLKMSWLHLFCTSGSSLLNKCCASFPTK
ncbi:MAG: hypothetical protein EU540_06400 [Promethearchaeota archaeon]|nr:MAG: hypothetical protein EU540_06400 [Candidatus Lokiarchaeota archaeon]